MFSHQFVARLHVSLGQIRVNQLIVGIQLLRLVALRDRRGVVAF